MANAPQIGKREKEILTAIVETYISTGEPVGSRTLARQNREQSERRHHPQRDGRPCRSRDCWSSRTPPPGACPASPAYRYYVEQLGGGARLTPEQEQAIAGFFQGTADVQDFMERTSHVLSLISHNVGVAVASAGKRNALEHVHFQRLAEKKVLAVVVTRSGLVRDRVLRLPRDLRQRDLDLAGRYINQNFRGWKMEDGARELSAPPGAGAQRV